MLHPRNILIFAGLLILMFGGYSAWRAANPPLPDREQIEANLEAIRVATQARNAKKIASYLAPEFSWNGMKKSELQNQMVGTFLQWRDVTANLTGVQISLEGERATVTGKFSLAFKPNPRARPDAYIGNFKVLWQKQNGQWKIVALEGLPNDNP